VPMSMHNVYFAIPGNLQSLTGGYGYDRRLLAGLQQLGVPIRYHALAAGFPDADATALAAANRWLQSLPDHSTVLVDGLAFAVMDQLARAHCQRLHFCALCHHPLALETGLSAVVQAKLQQSEQRALAVAAQVIVTSARTRQLLTERFAVPAERITVALPGTDRCGSAPCSGQPPCLLTVASLTRRKAHDVLIAALAQLQHLPWQALLVGGDAFDPGWATQLRQQVQDLGLQQRIVFKGAKRDLHADYMAADVFVLPSLYEGYGMAFAEALSYGLPIIAARAGAVPEVVPDTAGLLVEPGNVEALSVALQQILTDAGLRRRLQAGAQAAALQLPTWEQTALTVRDVLMRAAHR
jgi:glycosyltransferase involved in cell wall biosynthesis